MNFFIRIFMHILLNALDLTRIYIFLLISVKSYWILLWHALCCQCIFKISALCKFGLIFVIFFIIHINMVISAFFSYNNKIWTLQFVADFLNVFTFTDYLNTWFFLFFYLFIFPFFPFFFFFLSFFPQMDKIFLSLVIYVR